MKYQCKNCGTSLGYDGLCWRCRAMKERQEVLAWTDEEIQEKLRHLAANAGKLDDYRASEYATLCQLMEIRGICPPQLQRAALEAGAFSLAHLYYHAPADVRDGLILRLMETPSPHEAACLMECLAMQGDDLALEILLELERHPRPWRQQLYVDPSVYAQCGGWTFDSEGNRLQLNFDTSYALVKEEAGALSPTSRFPHILSADVSASDPSSAGATPENSPAGHSYSPVKIGRIRQDRCPHCGCSMADMLILDGRDERLEFLGIDGIFTASCCPNCVGFTEASFSRYTLDGGSEPLYSELEISDVEDYLGRNGIEELSSNSYVLDNHPVPIFLGAGSEDLNTIGGFANWIQDWQYAVCPDCGRPMRYLAQIQWDTVLENMEGTLYIEFCPDCRVAAMIHQQT